MTRKVYRTAQGKLVDLGALQLRNENVRAVGNMNVNSRGDLIDSNNKPIVKRNQTVNRQYARQTTNVSDSPVPTGRRSTAIPTPPEDFNDDFEKPKVKKHKSVEPVAPTVAQTVEEPKSAEVGLAAAIARARQVKQEPIKTPRELAQQKPGVRKI